MVAAATVFVEELFQIHEDLELLAQDLAAVAELVLFVGVETIHLLQLLLQLLQELLHLKCHPSLCYSPRRIKPEYACIHTHTHTRKSDK